jgi:hypothetical protein
MSVDLFRKDLSFQANTKKDDTDVQANAGCSVCGKSPATKKCSRCKVARYCTVECQKAHWTAGHKEECSTEPGDTKVREFTTSRTRIKAVVVAAEKIQESIDNKTEPSLLEQYLGEWDVAIGEAGSPDESRVTASHPSRLSILFSASTAHESSGPVQIRICDIVANLCRLPASREIVGTSGGVTHVLRAMEVHADSAEVQEKACRALYNLALCDENEKAIVAAGGTQQVLKAMEAHSSIAGVQEEACGVLKNIAVDVVSRGVLCVAGAGGIVLKALETHVTAGVQAEACALLKHLAWPSDHADETLSEASGGAARAEAVVLKAMEAHEGDAEVQEAACAALAVLVGNNHKGGSGNSLAVAEIAQVLRAMELHEEEEGVQEEAVAALLVLAVDADSRRAIGTEGCALVLKAMHQHGEEADLQRQCCGAVWNLANHEANKRALVEGGAEELIQAAAATHGQSIAQIASGALKFLREGTDAFPGNK